MAKQAKAKGGDDGELLVHISAYVTRSGRDTLELLARMRRQERGGAGRASAAEVIRELIDAEAERRGIKTL